MSILETFFILFKTDADEAAKDIEKVDKASDKAAAGMSKLDLAAGKVGSSFMAMARNLAAPLLALASIGTITSAVFNRIQEIDDIGDMAGKLRSSAADYEAFTRAVRASGGTLQDAAANLSTFNDKLNDAAARPDSINAKNFKKWGIIFKDVNGEALGAVDGLLSLAKSLEGVSQAEALGRLRRLGIEDADTIAFLLQGKAAIQEKMRAEREAGVVTERQIEIVGRYQSAIGGMQNVLDTLANALTEAVVPALTAGIEAFSRFVGWVVRNGTLVKGFFIGVAGVITALYLPAIVAAAAATLVAIAPFVAIAAAITAIGVAVALAYEDLMAFLNGQPSLIGALAERYWIVGAAIDNIGQRYRALKGAATSVLKGLAQAWDWLTSASETYSNKTRDFWATFKPIWEGIKDLVSAVGDLFSAVGARIASDLEAPIKRVQDGFNYARDAARDLFNAIFGDTAQVSGAVDEAASAIEDGFTAAFRAVKAVWDSTVGLIAAGIRGLADGIRGLAGAISGAGSAASPPAANDNLAAAGSSIGAMMGAGKTATADASGAAINTAQPGAVNTVNTSNVSVGSVTVNTQATNAAEVAGAVRGELQKQLRGTAAQFDDGVAR